MDWPKEFDITSKQAEKYWKMLINEIFSNEHLTEEEQDSISSKAVMFRKNLQAHYELIIRFYKGTKYGTN